MIFGELSFFVQFKHSTKGMKIVNVFRGLLSLYLYGVMTPHCNGNWTRIQPPPTQVTDNCPSIKGRLPVRKGPWINTGVEPARLDTQNQEDAVCSAFLSFYLSNPGATGLLLPVL